MRQVLAVLFGLILPVAAAGQLEVPRGLLKEEVAAGLGVPITLDIFADGRILVGEQFSGNVQLVTNGVVSPVGTVAPLDTSIGDRGLLSIAIDPGYPTRPYLYVWYTHPAAPTVRLGQYEILDLGLGQLGLGPEYVVLELPDLDPGHNGGTLRFGPDGYLYVSTGDDFVQCNAQDVNSLAGKILRLDVSALPVAASSGPPPKALITPASNPFVGTSDDAGLVWTLGLRHPFRFHIDPQTGELMITDVGEATFEEVDHVTAGGQNFGWPAFEAFSSHNQNCAVSSTVTNPSYVEMHPNAVSFISLGVYRPPLNNEIGFTSDYAGDYFFTDFVYGLAYRLKQGPGGWAIAPPEPTQFHPLYWGSGFFDVPDARFGPDGALYFVRYENPGKVLRVRADTAYPGNGSDCEITVAKNGQPVTRADGIYEFQAGDAVALNFDSPGGTLHNQPFALVLEAILPGQPSTPIYIPGDLAPSLWMSFTAFVPLDGFTFPNIRLWPGGFGLPPSVVPVWFQGSGVSLMVQLVVADPGRNNFDIGTSKALELRAP